MSSLGKFYLFADDTGILVKGREWDDVFSKMQELLSLVYGWLLMSVLTVNAAKTKYMLFGNKGSLRPHHKLIIHSCFTGQGCACQPLELVAKYKYLGVMLDDGLTWHAQIQHLWSRLRKFCAIFYNLRNLISSHRLKLVYISLVQSALQYCILVWGGTFPSTLSRLFTLQKSIIKIMLFRPRRYPSKLVFDEAKLFHLRKLFLKNLLMFFYKKPYLCNPTPTHMYPTRFTQLQNVINPKIATSRSSRSPVYLLHLIFNLLPPTMKLPLDHSRNQYKKMVYSWLIEVDYHNCEDLLKSIYL